MRKFVSLIALIFLAACTTKQAAPTQPTTALATTPARTATAVAYPPPAYPVGQTAAPSAAAPSPIVPTAAPRMATPSSTPTSIPTPTIEPTLPPLRPHVELDDLTLFDENSGWALQAFYTPSSAGDYHYDVERKIIRTTQGFQRWKDVSPPPLPEKMELSKTFFFNPNTAVAIYLRYLLPDQPGTELTGVRTTDGGRTWQVGETIHVNCCLSTPAQVEMLDANQGWMLAGGQGAMGQFPVTFYRTEDGGLHWKEVYDSDKKFQTDSNAMFGSANLIGGDSLTLLDFNTALYATGWLYRSNDGGKNWQQISLTIPPAASDLEAQAGMGKYEPIIAFPQFWTEKDGVLVGRYYIVEQVPAYHPTDLPVSEFLYSTHDSGQTWTFSRSPVRIGRPYFLDSTTGWYLGKSDPDPAKPTQLYQTTDGGQTWKQILSDCPLPLGSVIHFLDARMGYASSTGYSTDTMFDSRAGFAPYFFFTGDGGNTWEQVEPGETP